MASPQPATPLVPPGPSRRHLPREGLIAALAVTGIAAHLVLRFTMQTSLGAQHVPLFAVLVLGGAPLVFDLARKAFRGQFGSDLLAGLSIVTAVVLGEYLAGAFVVLMLSGGETLEAYAAERASSVLEALARRMPLVAHRQRGGIVEDITIEAIDIGDRIIVPPHEICPVDGVVVEGHGVMDESYLTGEPFMMSKAPGSDVFSGAINGEASIVIQASRRAVDSRYARIMDVMRESQQQRPEIRRLGDTLGAWYTPLALGVGATAWAMTGEPVRFLAVLVVATPCPLLLGIPIAIIGSISLAAKRGIIVRDPAVLERIDRCQTIILDKTGTLTYGRPTLTDRVVAPGFEDRRVLQLASSVERYSKHPLAAPIVDAAQAEGVALLDVLHIREHAGEGLEGSIDGSSVRIIGRKQAVTLGLGASLPPVQAGLECVVLVNGAYAAVFRFHDVARDDSRLFIAHLGSRHRVTRVLLVSGDRAEEVEYLARHVGITEVFAAQSPEEKVAITRRETERAPTLFIGDGINDAPALVTATAGVAFGNQSEVTSQAAGAVIMDASLKRVDEFLHISHRMRRIALQSAVGGMLLSIVGMAIAASGHLPPVGGAIFQEVIDLAAVLNALRAAMPGGQLSDY
jgi:heavy metal translocating P-type ATPase